MVFTRFGVLFCLEVGLLTATAQVLPLRHDLSESPSGGAEAAAFTPDGKLLVSVRDRGRLRLWDTATGKILTRIDSYGEPNGCYTKHRGMSFSPDGKTLAIGVRSGITATGHVILFDVVDGQSLERKTSLEGHTAGVTVVTYTPDGRTLISAGLDKEIRLWDVATGKTRQILRGHTERILGMALSPDGKVLVSGDPGEVKVWDPETGKETGAWKVVDLVGLAISPDGRIAAVDSFPEDGITFWDIASRKARADLQPLPEGASPMEFSPDGRLFVSVNRDRKLPPTVTVTELAESRTLAHYSHPTGIMLVVAFSPDGKGLASANSDTQGNTPLLLMDVSGLLERKP